jgi:phage tail sheath protein FI
MQWVVFEPNPGAFFARQPRTMTKDDMNNGRLSCVIGVALVSPAEFAIFRLLRPRLSPPR